MASTAYRAPQGELMAGWHYLFSNPRWVNLGHEVSMHAPIPGTHILKRIDVDILLLDTQTNELWIFDAKTTGKTPWLRAQTLRVEAAPPHYLSVAQHNLEAGLLHESFPQLPKDVKLGGFMHLLLGKPKIRLSQKDCDSGLVSSSKRHGKATAMPQRNGAWSCRYWQDPDAPDGAVPTEVRDASSREAAEAVLGEWTKVQVKPSYFGEPKIGNYIRRCRDVFTATGDYAELKDEYAERPPVMLSRISASFLRDPVAMHRYETRLARVVEYAEMAPLPLHFDPTPDGMENFNSLSVYAPFYTAPVSAWPEIIQKHHFIQNWFED